MKPLLYISCLILIFSCGPREPEDEKVTGLLLLSPWRTDNSFDLFLPCSIDTSKTLLQNLNSIHKDTSYRIHVGSLGFSKQAIKMRNEAYGEDFADDTKYCVLIPITAKKDVELKMKMGGEEESEVFRLPYTFHGKTITESYSNKEIFLKNIQVLKLVPGEKGG